MVIWIGYLQWMHVHGITNDRRPILDKLQTIENRDAILTFLPLPPGEGRGEGAWKGKMPVRAEWPETEFIIGNPPFLGSKVFRQQGLVDDYLNALWKAYDLPRSSDLCCYWFEQARGRIANPLSTRIGLLATQGIRGGDNRTVLERITDGGSIFAAWSDKEWVLDGAAVHVSIVAFGPGTDPESVLDGIVVKKINADLRAGADMARASLLPENEQVRWSIGTQKGGDFDVEWSAARSMFACPTVAGRSMLDVVRPWLSGVDITARNRGKWIIYFAPSTSASEAALYDAPFEYSLKHVKPFRDSVRRDAYRERWWIHQEAREGLEAELRASGRFIVTPTLTKHRLFRWSEWPTLPDKQTTVFVRADDFFLGVLHSSVHELWARRMGTQLREAESGFRYTPTTCFKTFPLPWPPGTEPVDHLAYKRISAAAAELNERRERWLNPPEWVAEVAAKVDAADTFSDVPPDARPLIRHSAIMAAAAKDARLKKRTLTNLYNERPTWLKLAHEQLDRAVLAAYAATDPEGGWREDWAKVWVDTGAGQPLPKDHPLVADRAKVDQAVLCNLLRLNKQRQ